MAHTFRVYMNTPSGLKVYSIDAASEDAALEDSSEVAPEGSVAMVRQVN